MRPRFSGVNIDAVHKKRKPIRHLEFQHQCVAVQWARMQERRFPELRFLFAIPNAFGRKITPAQAGRYKAEGVRAGPPDLCLPLVIPGEAAGLWVEMKAPEQRTAKAGGLSESQLDFRTHLIAEGYEHHVCYDGQEAMDILKDYHARYREARRLDVPRGTDRHGIEDVRVGYK